MKNWAQCGLPKQQERKGPVQACVQNQVPSCNLKSQDDLPGKCDGVQHQRKQAGAGQTNQRAIQKSGAKAPKSQETRPQGLLCLNWEGSRAVCLNTMSTVGLNANSASKQTDMRCSWAKAVQGLKK